MRLFRPDARQALVKARAEFASTEAKITKLRARRTAALVDADDIAAIEATDGQIAAAQRALGIYNDRIAALTAEVAELERARCEKARAAAIEIIAGRLAERDRLAAELETSVRRTADLYFQLVDSGSVAEEWPAEFPTPRPNFGLLPLDSIRMAMSWLLFSVGRPISGHTQFPAPDSGSAGIGLTPGTVTETVAAHSEVLLESLHTLPLGDAVLPDEQQERAA